MREGNTFIPMADSCWYMAKTNTMVESNYPPIKNKLKKKKEEADSDIENKIMFTKGNSERGRDKLIIWD